MRSKSCKFLHRRFASTTTSLCREILYALDTDISKKAADFLVGDHSALVQMSINPSDYPDCETFRRDYLAVELLSKSPDLDLDVDREAVAIEKFLQAEKWCSEANFRLTYEVPGSLYSPYTPLSVLQLAKLKIASLLGPFCWSEAELHFGFGPGATTSLSRRQGDAYFKYGAVRPHTTEGNLALAWCAVKRIPAWERSLLEMNRSPLDKIHFHDFREFVEIVPGNKIVTVPKSAKTDRVIAIEPDLNMFVQKGIGGMIRSRLKRVKIDLDDQSLNQSLAKEGSLTDSLATIDLSSASDSVSLELTRMLMPSDWMVAIEQSRSPRGTLPSGEIISYEKVSSMGNGFTFELESLIFWAISVSVVELFQPLDRRVAVYGDDIIVSSSIAGSLIWMLSFCGFQANLKKTFVKGPFRESCGKHYFRGTDVTPFYIRKDIKTPDRLLWLANSIRRWSRLDSFGLDPLLKSVYDTTVALLPSPLQRPSIPDGYGDMALIGDFDECLPSYSPRYQAWMCRGYVNIKRNFDPDGVGRLLRSLASGERSTIPTWRGGGFPSGICSYWKQVTIPVTRWESYGPWLGS